jgi:uncharacterized YkwD family protein
MEKGGINMITSKWAKTISSLLTAAVIGIGFTVPSDAATYLSQNTYGSYYNFYGNMNVRTFPYTYYGYNRLNSFYNWNWNYSNPVRQLPVQQPAPKPITQPAPAPMPAPVPVSTPAPQPPVLQGQASSEIQQVLALVNQERAKAGVAPLKLSDTLDNMAKVKAEDMRDQNYFSHTSPTYGSPFDMMKKFGIHYSTAGENIAAGQQSAADVMNSWMNSPGHRQNILNPNYTEIGIGVAKGGSYGIYWVQDFIRP